MKKPMTLITLALCSIASMSYAKSEHSIDYARVTQVKPIYETIERRVPREQCWVETVREERPGHRAQSTTGTLLGGLIGGAVGHAVGHGKSNKKIGAVVGTVLGMSIANDAARHHNRQSHYRSTSYRDVERCETHYQVKTEQVLNGYDVEYKYRGRLYNTFMEHQPGDKIKVAVQVTPLLD